jgi:hypothetical protein
MSANPKHPSTTKSTALLWMIFLSPVVGALTFVLAGHYGLTHLAIFETTVAALAAWWLATYVFIRVVRWHKRKGPTSLIDR